MQPAQPPSTTRGMASRGTADWPVGGAGTVAYEPTSRRPIADLFRKTAHSAVKLCVGWNIHPDAISYLSVVASCVAAVCFWQSGNLPFLLIAAPAFCYFRLWCNMLDGMVAIASGKASWRGEILNDLPDRISDVVIFAGVAHSGWAIPVLGYWAAVLALLTAYVGMLGQAVGVHREFSGLMAKPWRMVALHLGAWSAFACDALLHQRLFGALTMLDWACVVVLVGCVQTIVVRLSRIMAALRAKSAGNP
jgi:phosphatidylglycerophosphate synthase